MFIKKSIAAAWSGNYDPETMKIAADESSDEIQVYHLEDFDLVDTPGLFGFKERSNQVKYKEITKKYVSEANLILYVMNPNNPIKDSHKEELDWLFKDLSLLPRTVFVISRFDEEADIEDSKEYNERFETKKENVLCRLRDFGIISDYQLVPIVAVSANPFGEGFDYWLSNRDEYNQISHIADLQVATVNQIKNSGGENALVLATNKSIVKDVIQRQTPVVQEKVADAVNEISKFKNALSNIKHEQEKSERNIGNVRIELRSYVENLFTDLIIQINGSDIETFNEVFERNIGAGGIVLDTNIKNEFERQLGTIALEISKAETSFNASINHYNNIVGDLSMQGVKMGGEFLKKTQISNKTVLGARDFVMPSFKFKPWGAVKFAEKLSNGAAIFGSVIGVGFEVWDTYSEAKKKEKFLKEIESIVEKLNQQRNDCLSFINNQQEFIVQYFPNEFNLRERVSEMEKEMLEREGFKQDFEEWKRDGEIIEANFEVIY